MTIRNMYVVLIAQLCGIALSSCVTLGDPWPKDNLLCVPQVVQSVRCVDLSDRDPVKQYAVRTFAVLAMGDVTTPDADMWTQPFEAQHGLTFAILRWETPDELPQVEALARVPLWDGITEIQVLNMEKTNASCTSPRVSPVARYDWHRVEDASGQSHQVLMYLSQSGVTLEVSRGIRQSLGVSSVSLKELKWKATYGLAPEAPAEVDKRKPDSNVFTIVNLNRGDSAVALVASTHHVVGGRAHSEIQGFIVVALLKRAETGLVVLEDINLLIPGPLFSDTRSLEFVVVRGARVPGTSSRFHFNDENVLLFPVAIDLIVSDCGVEVQAAPLRPTAR